MNELGGFKPLVACDGGCTHIGPSKAIQLRFADCSILGEAKKTECLVVNHGIIGDKAGAPCQVAIPLRKHVCISSAHTFVGTAQKHREPRHKRCILARFRLVGVVNGTFHQSTFLRNPQVKGHPIRASLFVPCHSLLIPYCSLLFLRHHKISLHAQSDI